MYRLICQKPAHFSLPKWLWWAPFFQMFIVLGMYNFAFRVDCRSWSGSSCIISVETMENYAAAQQKFFSKKDRENNAGVDLRVLGWRWAKGWNHFRRSIPVNDRSCIFTYGRRWRPKTEKYLDFGRILKLKPNVEIFLNCYPSVVFVALILFLLIHFWWLPRNLSSN